MPTRCPEKITFENPNFEPVQCVYAEGHYGPHQSVDPESHKRAGLAPGIWTWPWDYKTQGTLPPEIDKERICE